MSAHWKMFTRCINLSTTRKATFFSRELFITLSNNMKGVANWNCISNKICWFLDRLRCIYFLIKQQWFNDSDSAQTGYWHINCWTRSFSSSPLWSQNPWPRRVTSKVQKLSFQWPIFYFCLYSYGHTFCSWLISFCLVWRATKACSCSICSCCFSSTASCICWDRESKRMWLLWMLLLREDFRQYPKRFSKLQSLLVYWWWQIQYR